MQGWARVAELTKAKNREGGFVVQCATGLPFVLEEGMHVCFIPPRLDAPRSGCIERLEMMDERRAFVMFDSVHDLSTAELLVGSVVLAPEDQIPLPVGLASGALEGFEVRDSKFGFVGTVQGLLDNPAHPLLVVSSPQGEVLIPCVDEFIAAVDELERVVETSVPDGLLDLR